MASFTRVAVVSFSRTRIGTKIDGSEPGALQCSTEVVRRALRADSAFLLTSVGDTPALLCRSSDAHADEAGEGDLNEAMLAICDSLSAASTARYQNGAWAWLGTTVRLGTESGALCVAATAPRNFDDADVATIVATGALVETLEERARLPLQVLVDLSGTLLRDTSEIDMPADSLRAAADSLDAVAMRLRELAAPPLPTAAPTCGRLPTRILLADDLDLNRRLIADMLSLDGHQVDCVSDGVAAVRAAASERYDLVLMDMIMPEMDGLAATRAIRALPRPARDVPIVALTANAMPDQLDSCLEAGMDAALTKPMSLDALTAAVAHWVRGRNAAA